MDPVGAQVTDIDISTTVQCNADGACELTIPGSIGAELADINAAGIKFLDTLEVQINHVNIVATVNRQATRRTELAVTGARGSKLTLIDAAGIKFLNAAVAIIGNK